MRSIEHQQLDLAYLGYTNADVHKIVDIAVKWLGAGHRIIHHSYGTVEFIETLLGKEGRKIALFHLLLDMKVLDGEELLKKAKELGWKS